MEGIQRLSIQDRIDGGLAHTLTLDELERYAIEINSAPLMAGLMLFKTGKVATLGEALQATAVHLARANQELHKKHIDLLSRTTAPLTIKP